MNIERGRKKEIEKGTIIFKHNTSISFLHVLHKYYVRVDYKIELDIRP